jgi:drug/metabolite transporter (DMT)-like permease
MKQRGVSVTAAILGLSVLVPVGISLLAWGESATLPQTFGIVAAIVSLPLLSVGPTPASVAEKKKRVIHLVLLAGVFILNGLALVAARAFHQTGVKDEDTIFLFFIFTSATLTTCVVWAIQEIRRRNIPKLGGRETNNKGSVLWGVLFGIVAGLCNAFTNRFIIASLYKLPGIIVYPFYSAVGLLLTVVFSRLAWKEKIRGVEATGMAFAFVSIILMNFVS